LLKTDTGGGLTSFGFWFSPVMCCGMPKLSVCRLRFKRLSNDVDTTEHGGRAGASFNVDNIVIVDGGIGLGF
jgi:hypothetical protein